MARTLYSEYHEMPVYPGHPVTLALEIMLAFDRDIDLALSPSVDRDGNEPGWCKAVGSLGVSGAGGNVYQASGLLRKIRTGEMSISDAIKWGMEAWERQTKIGNDHRKLYEEGQKQAERMVWPLMDQLYRAMAEGKL